MKRTLVVLAMVPLLAALAAAQDAPVQEKQKANLEKMQADLQKMAAESRVVRLKGAAMGSTVKNAPYSAVEITESTQMLGDGTRIHNESRTSVYRDGEGRVRRETPDEVTIWDPVANVSYFLDPKNQTAQKTSMVRTFVYSSSKGAVAGSTGVNTTFEMRTKDGATTATLNGNPVDPSTLPHLALPEGGKGELQSEGYSIMIAPPPSGEAGVKHVVGGGIMPRLVKSVAAAAPSESLGSKVIEGVNSEGSRSVVTLDAGAVGNDRPIEISSERWYSPELQTVVMTRHNDPRSGEEIFRLTNVNRSEPPAYLFQVPPGFQMNERK